MPSHDYCRRRAKNAFARLGALTALVAMLQIAVAYLSIYIDQPIFLNNDEIHRLLTNPSADVDSRTLIALQQRGWSPKNVIPCAKSTVRSSDRHRAFIEWKLLFEINVPGQECMGRFAMYLEAPISVQFYAGWPFRCIGGEESAFMKGDSMPIAGLWGVARSRAFIMPKQLLWIGSILNTALYVGLLVLIKRCVVTLVKVYRRVGGRCMVCGYNLLGAYENGCPECGWGRDKGQPKPATSAET